MELLTPTAMAKLVALWESYLREELMQSPRTVLRYREVMDRFSLWLGVKHDGEAFSLETVTKAELEEYLRFESMGRDGDPSKATWNLRLAGLRAFYSWLLEKERIEVNPTLKVRRHKKPTTTARTPMDFSELIRLLKAIEDGPKAYRKRNLSIVHVLFGTAVRVSELVSLNLNQLDLEGHLFMRVRTKGDKSLDVAMSDAVAEVLERYLLDRERFLSKNPDETAVFVSDRGSRISVRSVQQMLQHYGEAAGIKKPVTPHVLRHSAASSLSALGTPIEVVQEVLGHADIRTTRRYVHVNSERKREAVDQLGVALKRSIKQGRKGLSV